MDSNSEPVNEIVNETLNGTEIDQIQDEVNGLAARAEEPDDGPEHDYEGEFIAAAERRELAEHQALVEQAAAVELQGDIGPAADPDDGDSPAVDVSENLAQFTAPLIRNQAADALDRIHQASKEVDLRRAEMDEIKHELKAAKGEHDAAVEKLQRIIREETSPKQTQDEAAEEAGEPNADVNFKAEWDRIQAESQANIKRILANEPDKEDTSWEQVTLDEAIGSNVSAGIMQAMTDANLHTMGDLVAWQEPPRLNQLTDLKGVGAHKAEQILKALDLFWQRWNRPPLEPVEIEVKPAQGSLVGEYEDV